MTQNQVKMGQFYKFLTRVEELALMWQEFRLGGFRQMLMDCIAKAPMVQRARMAGAYPEEVEAVRRFETEEGWWESIQEKVEKARLGYERGDGQEEAEV